MLDLFAGTGALGIEAISRGAKFALFVDNGAEARALLRNNVESLGLGGVTKVYRRDAANLGPAHPMEPFSLVFLDPPYGKGLAEKALASLRDGGWLTPGRAAGGGRSQGGGVCVARWFRGAGAAGVRRYGVCVFACRVRWSPKPHSSCPAKAGHPVFRSVDARLDRRGVLDRPVKPGDDSLRCGHALPHLRPNSFSISASFNST